MPAPGRLRLRRPVSGSDLVDDRLHDGSPASQAATRAVALCSGLWDGGRTIEQIDADNGGVGGTEAMQTNIDFRLGRSCRSSTRMSMPPRIVVWRPVLGCAQLPIGATEDAIQHTAASRFRCRPTRFRRSRLAEGDQKAIRRLSKAKQKALDDYRCEGLR